MAAAVQCLLCQVDTSYLALPISQIVEVTRPLPLTRLPDAPDWLAGVCVLRGEVTPVVDARRLLTDSPAHDGPIEGERWVSLRANGKRAALAVDSVLRAHTLPVGHASTPPLLASNVVSEFSALDAKLLMVLEGATLLSHEALENLEGHVAGR